MQLLFGSSRSHLLCEQFKDSFIKYSFKFWFSCHSKSVPKMDFSISTEGSGRSHRVIGYVIGVLGLLVCCVVIYGVGGPLFPTRRMSIGDREKGNYENFAPIIASKCFTFRLLLENEKLLCFVFRVQLFGGSLLAVCSF